MSQSSLNDRHERHLMRQRGAGPRNVNAAFGFAFDFPTPPASSDPATAQPPAKRRKTIFPSDDTVARSLAVATEPVIPCDDVGDDAPPSAEPLVYGGKSVAPKITETAFNEPAEQASNVPAAGEVDEVVKDPTPPRTVRKTSRMSRKPGPPATDDAGDDSFIANLRPKRARAKRKRDESTEMPETAGVQDGADEETVTLKAKGKTPRKAATVKTPKTSKTPTTTRKIAEAYVEEQRGTQGRPDEQARSTVPETTDAVLPTMAAKDAVAQAKAAEDLISSPPAAKPKAKPRKKAAPRKAPRAPKAPARAKKALTRTKPTIATSPQPSAEPDPRSPDYTHILWRTQTETVATKVFDAPTTAAEPPRTKRPFSYAEDIDDSLLSHPPTVVKKKPRKPRAAAPKRAAGKATAGRKRKRAVSPELEESVHEVDEIENVLESFAEAPTALEAMSGDEGRKKRRRALQESDVNIVRGLLASPEKGGMPTTTGAKSLMAEPKASATARRTKATADDDLDAAKALSATAARPGDDDDALLPVSQGIKRRRPSTERTDSASSAIEAPPPKRKRRKFADILAEMGL